MISTFFQELFEIVNDSSFYLLLGFFIAGLIHEFVSSKKLAYHLGGSSLKSIIKASLIGAPLPLCSCGVIPAAVSLRKDGASQEATVSFLISTPETGVDSISISYALLDPLLTVVRPIAAIITSIVAGIAEKIFGKKKKTGNNPVETNTCKCEETKSGIKTNDKNFWRRLKSSINYGFLVFFGDIVIYLLFGFILAALIATLIPEKFILENFSGKGILPLLGMLVLGIPLYICSTSATPIASALLLKGIAPGTALVLLLSGPATNITTILTVGKFLGRRSLLLYILSISSVSVLLGLVVNWIYDFLHFTPQAKIGQGAEIIPDVVKLISTFLFMILILDLILKKARKPSKQTQAQLQA
ncbi:MAG: SO_0444 family Cu/Zn efflux transporter [candidate division Zixibacteria bacterium]|nr:SO_0444 family Cu/Zn efflux transporter [candidate division Zixibacteria bacterium]